MKIFSLSMLSVLGLLLGSSTAFADNTKSGLASSDEKFIKEAAASGTGEMRMADLAVKKSSRADVKDFAQTLLTDHQKLDGELKALAQSKNVELSAVIDPKFASKFQDLEKSGSFDKDFLSQMESCHKSDISDFEKMSSDSKDSDIKAFANKNLPTLRSHLDKIKDLKGK